MNRSSHGRRPENLRGRFCIVIIALFVCHAALAELPAADRAGIWTRVWERLTERFVGFERVPGLRWRQEYVEGLAALRAAPTDVEFWRELRRRLVRLENGRTSVKFPVGLPREFDSVPLRAMLVGERVFVKRLSTQEQLVRAGIRVGDEVIAVDGFPVLAYLDSVAVPNTSGSRLPARRAAGVYRLLTGRADSQVHVELRRPSGEIYAVTLTRDSGLNSQYINDLDEPVGDEVRVLDGGILYVNCFAHLVPNTDHVIVAQLESRPELRALILDMRESQTGILLENVLAHFISREVVVESGWMMSDTLVTSRSDLGALEPSRSLAIRRGRVLKPVAPHFDGRIIALVSAITAGQAEEFLHALGDRVTLIGDTTAGAAHQVAVVDLGEGAAVTYAVVKPDWGNDLGDGVGLAPAQRVLLTGAGMAGGKDEVLDAAVRVIKD